jgi:hypothetical protein
VLEASTRAPHGATVGPGRRTHRADGFDVSQTMKNDAKPWPKPAPRTRRCRRSPEHRTRWRLATATAALLSGKAATALASRSAPSRGVDGGKPSLAKGQGFHGNPNLRRRTHRAPTTGTDAFGRLEPRDGPTGPTTCRDGPTGPPSHGDGPTGPRPRGQAPSGALNRATDPPGPRPAVKGTYRTPSHGDGPTGPRSRGWTPSGALNRATDPPGPRPAAEDPRNPEPRRRTHRAPTTGMDAFGRPEPRDGPTGPTTRGRGSTEPGTTATDPPGPDHGDGRLRAP